MDACNKARKSGKKDLYKKLRNKVTKLVKRDQIQSVLSRLGKNPEPKKAWHEAKMYLGSGHSSILPDCTNNSDPNLTAENQNSFFISKIERLVESIQKVHEGKKSFKCESCDFSFDLEISLQQHVASLHEGRSPFKCESCDNSFDLKSSLQQHVASVH